ncbi:MAG: leucine-rich repeat domain-containing protein [Clostridiales bacterium]|nr:leucine-rich repeat domain-containing protein [Clostridiales bacterium]
MKRLHCLLLCILLLCACAPVDPILTQQPTPTSAAAIPVPVPRPTNSPEPTTLPIDDPRDFLVGYWADVARDKIYQFAYSYDYDEELDDYISDFFLSPYEYFTRYAFYPDGQFLRAIPHGSYVYPTYEYGSWQLSENHDSVILDISERYVCGEDETCKQTQIIMQETLPISIGSEYLSRGQNTILINETEFFRSNMTWDLMNDFSYAKTGEMYHGNSWDSDTDSADYNGEIGLPKIYFEGTIVPGSEEKIYRSGYGTLSGYRIQLSRGADGLVTHFNNYPTIAVMESSTLSFVCDDPIEDYGNKQIRFTGSTHFHDGFWFEITDIEVPPEAQGWNYADGTLTITTNLGIGRWMDERESRPGYYEKSVKTLAIAENVYSVWDGAFKDLTVLTIVQFPASLGRIESSAFRGCASLKTLEFPQNLSYIGSHAFADCISLKQVTLPKDINGCFAAFAGCTALTELHIDRWFFNMDMIKGCDALQRLSLPASVTYITDMYRFLYSTDDKDTAVNQSLRQLVIWGDSIGISTYLLRDCIKLEQLVFMKGPSNNLYDKLFVDAIARPTIYYFRAYAPLWAPNNETEWNGYPLIPIDSLDDLPPLN